MFKLYNQYFTERVILLIINEASRFKDNHSIVSQNNSSLEEEALQKIKSAILNVNKDAHLTLVLKFSDIDEEQWKNRYGAEYIYQDPHRKETLLQDEEGLDTI